MIIEVSFCFGAHIFFSCLYRRKFADILQLLLPTIIGRQLIREELRSERELLHLRYARSRPRGSVRLCDAAVAMDWCRHLSTNSVPFRFIDRHGNRRQLINMMTPIFDDQHVFQYLVMQYNVPLGRSVALLFALPCWLVSQSTAINVLIL